MNTRGLITLMFLCSIPASGFGQAVPSMINYQGRLSDSNGAALPTGDYQLTFNIYDTTNGGNLIWGPQIFDGSNGVPGHGSKIPVVQGYFNVKLGPSDTNGSSLASGFNASNRYIQITVGSNNPILPRQQILSAPFAFNSAKLAGADWSALFGTNDPVNGLLPTARLATNGTIIAQFVGIQTPSPQWPLVVAGTALVSKPSNPAQGLFMTSSVDQTHYSWRIGAQQHNASLEFNASTATGVVTWAPPVLILNQSGKVGIGTINPAAMLDVGYDANLGGVGRPGTLRIYSDSASGSGAYGQFLPDNAHPGRTTFEGGKGSASTENTLSMNANLIDALDNTHDLGSASNRWKTLWVGTGNGIFQGNVAIGKTSPTTALDVNGTVTATTFNGNGTGLTGLSAAQLTSSGNTNGGSGNFFVGPSGNPVTTGNNNTANGNGALVSNTSGYNNTASGYSALDVNTSGYANTANGAYALYSNTNGYENTGSGYSVLYSNTIGSDNTATGFRALNNNTIGSYNTANGDSALYSNTRGSNNIAVGYLAGYNIATGSGNIDIGNQGLPTDTNIVRIGSGQTATYLAGAIYGNGSGLTSLSAAQLTSVGNTNGGSGNFFVGQSGSQMATGNNNTANGLYAVSSITSGSFNTANGYAALSFNTSGSWNTASGHDALMSNTNGSGNTAFGVQALDSNTSGSNNIALGYQAGHNITTGSSNIDIGHQGLAADTNIIRLGNGQTATFIAGISGATTAGGTAVYVSSSGQLGTLTSSARFKTAIHEMKDASEDLFALEPVTFRYKPEIDPRGLSQFGLVAEEVEKVNPDLVIHDDAGRPYTVRYEAINAMLLNEFLKEHKRIAGQNEEIRCLKQRNESLERRLESLEQTVKSLSRSN